VATSAEGADAGFHAVAPDMRGYGQMDRPEAMGQVIVCPEPSCASLVSVAKRIKVLQIAGFLRFMDMIFLDLNMCVASHVCL
jgi:hypothetical protein